MSRYRPDTVVRFPEPGQTGTSIETIDAISTGKLPSSLNPLQFPYSLQESEYAVNTVMGSEIAYSARMVPRDRLGSSLARLSARWRNEDATDRATGQALPSILEIRRERYTFRLGNRVSSKFVESTVVSVIIVTMFHREIGCSLLGVDSRFLQINSVQILRFGSDRSTTGYRTVTRRLLFSRRLARGYYRRTFVIHWVLSVFSRGLDGGYYRRTFVITQADHPIYPGRVDHIDTRLMDSDCIFHFY